MFLEIPPKSQLKRLQRNILTHLSKFQSNYPLHNSAIATTPAIYIAFLVILMFFLDKIVFFVYFTTTPMIINIIKTIFYVEFVY